MGAYQDIFERVEKKFIPLLQRCNIDCQPLIDKQRRLIINLGDQYQIILVKGEDMPKHSPLDVSKIFDAKTGKVIPEIYWHKGEILVIR